MQRREFVRTLAAGAAVLMVIPARRLLQDDKPLANVGSEGWSGAAFESVRGASFRVSGPDGTQSMTLEDVRHRQHRGIETASLRFRGDARSRVAQDSYKFEHPSLPSMGILLVPGTTSGGDCFYRATFNRFV
jgi:hypothetical protein